MNKIERIEILDFLRFSAAIFVMLYHYLYRGGLNGEYLNINYNYYDGVFKYGYLGVQFFFIISGYMIALSSENRPWKNFIKSRLNRLYPAYWVCLVFTVILVNSLGSDIFYVSFLDFIFNLSMISKLFGVPFADGAYWTLIYELVFYFWVFISLILKFKLVPLFYTIATIGFSLELLGFPDKITVIFGGMFTSYFLLGLLFYKLKIDGAKKSTIFGIVYSICLTVYHVVYQASTKINNSGASIDTLNVILILAMIILIFYFIAIGKLDNLKIKGASVLGAISYPAYLLHQNIGYVLINNLSIIINQWIVLFIVCIFVLILSYIVVKYIEPFVSKPLRQLMDKI